ncbi:MAG: adenylate cyclase [Clostridia bacterium]|jgi:CYTH domain-containing protein|nr:adenylate cyclase [Clostridia bacterium]
MEIERKFLVKELPLLQQYKNEMIIQAYISTDPVIRIRQTGSIYCLTVKSAGHMIREEFELPITKEQFTSLWSKTESPAIEKTRYFIPIENSLMAELDIFKGHLQGLITVEVEFSSAKDASCFKSPVWFGEDITHDKRYKNNYLSLYGMPK